MQEDASAMVDAILASRGFVVPATAPARFVAYLRAVEVAGATAGVLRARFPQASGPAADGAAWRFYEDRFNAGIEFLRTASVAEIADGAGSDAGLPSAYHTAGTARPDLGERYDAAVANSPAL